MSEVKISQTREFQTDFVQLSLNGSVRSQTRTGSSTRTSSNLTLKSSSEASASPTVATARCLSPSSTYYK